jgi:hypothetical protein
LRLDTSSDVGVMTRTDFLSGERRAPDDMCLGEEREVFGWTGGRSFPSIKRPETMGDLSSLVAGDGMDAREYAARARIGLQCDGMG